MEVWGAIHRLTVVADHLCFGPRIRERREPRRVSVPPPYDVCVYTWNLFLDYYHTRPHPGWRVVDDSKLWTIADYGLRQAIRGFIVARHRDNGVDNVLRFGLVVMLDGEENGIGKLRLNYDTALNPRYRARNWTRIGNTTTYSVGVGTPLGVFNYLNRMFNDS